MQSRVSNSEELGTKNPSMVLSNEMTSWESEQEKIHSEKEAEKQMGLLTSLERSEKRGWYFKVLATFPFLFFILNLLYPLILELDDFGQSSQFVS